MMQTIGFIGAGNMAHAMIAALINQGHNPQCIKISDTNAALLSQRKAELAVEIFNSNNALAERCDILLLAVKPQVLPDVCRQLSHSLSHNPLIISVAAGVKTAHINRWIGGNRAIVRAMPNTPALFNQGISGAFANSAVSTEQKALAETILTATGACLWLDNEQLIDAVTAISGSGPAYFFLMLEAMTQAGVSLGLDQSAAEKLSIQTALGSAIMAKQSTDSPQTLRQKVTSPNGTTEAAIKAFQQQQFEQTVAAAIQAAFERAQVLGTEMGAIEPQQ